MARRIGLAVIGACLALTGCGLLDRAPDGGRGCTLIGCESQLRFELANGDLAAATTYAVEICLDGVCETASIRIPGAETGPGAAGSADTIVLDPVDDVVVLVLPDGDYSGPHSASLRVVGPGVEVVEDDIAVGFERSQPNGPDCPPVCWQAVVRV